MGTSIWIVSEGTHLLEQVTGLVGRREKVIKALPQKARDLPIPGRILIECAHPCDFDRCAGNFSFALQYPAAPLYLITPLLNGIRKERGAGYVATRLRPPRAINEMCEDALSKLTGSYYPDGGRDHRIRLILSLQRLIVADRGRTRRLSDLAKLLGRSKSWISSNFPLVTGMTPLEFSEEVALCNCLWELKSTENSIKCIGGEYNFRESYFGVAFKRLFGRSPSAARLERP